MTGLSKQSVKSPRVPPLPNILQLDGWCQCTGVEASASGTRARVQRPPPPVCLLLRRRPEGGCVQPQASPVSMLSSDRSVWQSWFQNQHSEDRGHDSLLWEDQDLPFPGFLLCHDGPLREGVRKEVTGAMPSMPEGDEGVKPCLSPGTTVWRPALVRAEGHVPSSTTAELCGYALLSREEVAVPCAGLSSRVGGQELQQPTQPVVVFYLLSPAGRSFNWDSLLPSPLMRVVRGCRQGGPGRNLTFSPPHVGIWWSWGVGTE